ncbi:hypothetical protein N7492_009887 [Penicillium capsulatum]|uniref:Dicer-like protein 2 n=1 Tax=Penicillium capsulatum TaxID=69766 RepID=A0A9W9HLE0_9EURO|nr:hypothetical protein N7492_009887 [Penicillium capsulatum]KAJ6112398.1 hypothetical protein N7512_007722 [Penicillium capsulatum]
MDETSAEPAIEPPERVGSDLVVDRPRGYQLEMLEASLQQNIIVAMDTGSGKTLIAILRIIAELERCPTHKIVWFLAPTVALCLQQHEVIASYIPSIKTRTLTGLDNIDRWTQQAVWDEALKDIRVVVSTHAVLADALSHGFVQLSQLALIVFDEAHHCRRGHAANKIMQIHYHPTRTKFGPECVPSILGLTASPIVRSNDQELRLIESNLDAVCKTPRQNRTELLSHVHCPELVRISYCPYMSDLQGGSHLLVPLTRCIQEYRIEEDPYIDMLRQKPNKEYQSDQILRTGRTYCREQLKKFLERSLDMYEELGGWATDYFIEASIDALRRSIENDTSMTSLDREERIYLFELLHGLIAPKCMPDSIHISPKLEKLFDFLKRMDHPKFSGLVFAKRRATVSVLSRLLSIHPETKDRLRVSAYVGWSSNGSRKEMLGDLLSCDMQRDTLSEFRSGRLNLIVATDVLEEGLDVSSCSLVICYDKPANLKSFVQRRGRARHQQSTYAIMVSTADGTLDIEKWQSLEKAMIAAYQDDQRRRDEAQALEKLDEKVSEWLTVNSTNARLTADEAIQHLLHFCSVLPASTHVDRTPVFSFEENCAGMVRGTVILPNSVHPAVRRTQGEKWWRTERAARKEAAFQAYKSLWEYGLVNDNLLPLTRKPELRFTEDKQLPALVDCSEQYDPYVNLSQAWERPKLHQTTIAIAKDGMVEEDFLVSIVLPEVMEMPDPIPLYWEDKGAMIATMAPTRYLGDLPNETLQTMRDITALYLQAPSSRVHGPARDFIALFVPAEVPHLNLGEWFATYKGTDPALDIHSQDTAKPPLGIIRDTARFNEPRLFKRWIVENREAGKLHVEIECQSLPKRRNLLQPRTSTTSSEDGEPGPPKIHVIPAAGCTVDRLPAKKGVFGLVISAILYRLEAILVAARLNDTILKGVGIQNLCHVLTAITAPIAQASTHYQLYEFFGDAVLKFTVSCQLFFRQPTWHEGYLSESRDKLIQNKRLARAALDTGLDQFVLINRFTPRRWDAPLISTKRNVPVGKRKLSIKVLADVVEALIGAAYKDGGMRKAQACLHRFLPEIDIFTEDIGSYLNPHEPPSSKLVDPQRLEHVIGYTFNNSSYLTEALTHPSCENDMTIQSYQRIEYLGDAVLDMAVVSVLAAHPTELSQGQMTLIKHAVVNANLLAFLCMELSAGPDAPDDIHLWSFLRFNGPVIKTARDGCLERHRELREEIRFLLEHSNQYPWEYLSRLRADKFLSDIVESTLGAIFIDSRGNMDACSAFVERIGLLPYVRRILADNLDVQHPRNKAQNLVKSAGSLVFKSRRVEQKGGMTTYRCAALLNKEELALVEGCGSAEEADVRVAHLVIEKLMVKNGDG